MTSSLSLGCLALLATTSTVLAADLPARAIPPIVPIPLYSWTGFYAGVNAGYAFADNQALLQGTDGLTQLVIGAFVRPNPIALNPRGFSGGGQIGYNYQLMPASGTVVGVEIDAQYTDLTKSAFPVDTSLASTIQHKTSLDYLGTVRGRLGYAFDRVLVYGTGGFAYGQFNPQTILLDVTNNLSLLATGSRRSIETGWVVGGGIEYALPGITFLNAAVTVRAEYLHYDLGRRTILVPFVSQPFALQTTFRNEGDLVRGGINLKFGTY